MSENSTTIISECDNSFVSTSSNNNSSLNSSQSKNSNTNSIPSISSIPSMPSMPSINIENSSFNSSLLSGINSSIYNTRSLNIESTTNNSKDNSKDNSKNNSKDTSKPNSIYSSSLNIENSSNSSKNSSKPNSIFSSSFNYNYDNNSIFTNNTNMKQLNLQNNKIIIDVAVLCQEYTAVETMCNDHIVNLDEIPISKELFQSIFYPYGENFGLNKDYVCNNTELIPYISFLPDFRTVNKKKFYLLEELISNIESDLNISRNCFTKESLVELTNEIISIHSLCNINCCSVLTSLTWANIMEIINNYKLVKSADIETIVILVVNIIFKTPTPDVKNTLIRLQYKII
jgi:hypothetical protein